MNAHTARNAIQTEIANTIKAATGFDVEVTLSASNLRGPFVSIASENEAACDAAAKVVNAAIGIGAGIRFTDRDISDDEDGRLVVDFYRLTA